MVRYSRHDLEEDQARIWADRSTWKAEGIFIQSTALDIVRNSVVVGVVDLTPDAAATLSARYPGIQVVDEALDTQLDACNSVSDCYPMKGGLKIAELNHSTSYCTSGIQRTPAEYVHLPRPDRRPLSRSGHQRPNGRVDPRRDPVRDRQSEHVDDRFRCGCWANLAGKSVGRQQAVWDLDL